MGGLYEALSGAKGIRMAGKSAQNIAEYNAKVAEQQAKAEKLRSGFAQVQQAKAGERIKSALVAAMGAAGGAGSPVAIDITTEQAMELELENLLIGYEGEVRAKRAETQATLERLQGQLTRQRSKAAARQANIQFGMQLAGLGASSAPFLGGMGGSTPATQTFSTTPTRFGSTSSFSYGGLGRNFPGY